MELLIITATEEYEVEIKKILKESGVNTFSHMPVSGFKNLKDQPKESNWFAKEVGEFKSILFYAFVPKQNVPSIMEQINAFNATNNVLSKIHVAVMAVKETNIN
ncbi:MAG TPA: hypothetical protein PKL31_07890 [Fulvivirga sp.]|nr:hypothetical protein [Fulvivirga sp.]